MHHAVHDAAAVYAGHRNHGGAGANGTSGTVVRPLSPEVSDLLREQMEFLASAHVSDIRAALFLRLRLSAQQKLMAQRNRFSERRALQSKRWPTAVHSTATEVASAARSPEPVKPHPAAAEEVECEEGWRCPGCSRRYTDADAYTRHRNNCKKYVLLVKRQGGVTVPPSSRSTQPAATTFSPLLNSIGSTFKSELEVTQRWLEAAASASTRATVTTARYTPSTSNAPGIPPAQQAQRHAAAEGNTVAPLLPSALIESQSTNHSLLIPCFSAVDERREDRREFAQSPSLSRELTPSSFGMQSLHKMSPSVKNSIDDVPAAVADRASFDSVSPLPVWFSPSNTVKSRDNGASLHQSTLSCNQNSVMYNSATGSGTNWGETEGADEPLRPCPYCGRRFFSESRWPRHVAVCEQQQQQQRKNNSQASVARSSLGTRSLRPSRVIASGSLNSSTIIRGNSQPLASSREKPGNAKSSASGKPATKWRQQRAQLRQALQLPSTSSQDTPPNGGGTTDVFEDDRVFCPSCGRRFAPATAERHIPFCRERGSGQKVTRI
ncbi:uncharacterized protein TraAM80_05033 [Trypanosoma rangeli]|uniref:C2HC/C3H-type domain-containing protein n=1 Tax=Trypanosoma rangeli TaxID=5698 RepID=A0A3R7KMX3_TRYRA|nr:uncharacterized protein TraAM80_05033 [Trypanosoma rangeli]RNF04895.1 uncharacterized protein TraAM80_05033 [Trypanosoma rangeli]|eukprot:RNF04895.1 uncharacterized protein TraAM80_05033 [Trypanosoma rangeli]